MSVTSPHKIFDNGDSLNNNTMNTKNKLYKTTRIIKMQNTLSSFIFAGIPNRPLTSEKINNTIDR